MKYRRSIFSILALTLLCACGKEIPVQPEAEVTRVIHYVASVQGGPDTKATVDDGKHYVFEAGDQLYITSGDNMYGNLVLISGVGDNSAIFEGELNCVGGFEPTASTPLSATLVSLSDRIHTITDGKITGTNYPTNEFASGFADAVSKYSDFTSSSTYGNRHFTLAQQSGFLVFSITFDETVAAGTNTTVTLKNGDATTLRSASLQTETVEGAVRLDFAAGFPSSFSFSEGAELTVSGTDINDHYTIAPTTVLSNKYYTFGRNLNLMDYFTLETIEASTSITFNYATASDYVQYSTDGGRNWTSYLTTNGAIFVADAGTKVSFRARRTGYNCNNASAIVSADKPCYIYGNMMSLLCTDGFYTPATTLPSDNTFCAALKGATWARSHPTKKILLPATTLRNSCYWDLFNGCTGLTESPVANLPATSLIKECYKGMFYQCTNLTSAPAISATSFAQESCREMFYGCTGLTEVAIGNITSVGTTSCRGMFQGCTGITSITGALNAELKKECYWDMFNGCTALTTVPTVTVRATASTGWIDACRSMFKKCTSLVSPSVTISVTSLEQRALREMFYGCTSLTTAPDISSVTTLSGVQVCYQMYYDCTSLTTATVPSATILTSCCYYQMFHGAGLTAAPDLPATTLADRCYYQIFRNCTHLDTGPSSLPATTLAAVADNKGCYESMFDGCIALTSAPDLPATVLTDRCYRAMFWNCTSLSSAPAIYATTVASKCCQDMFQKCTFTTAPVLYAITLESECYSGMFKECRNLNSVTCLATSGINTSNTSNWMNGVSSSGTFTKAADATWPPGNSGIPSGWTTSVYSAP